MIRKSQAVQKPHFRKRKDEKKGKIKQQLLIITIYTITII